MPLLEWIGLGLLVAIVASIVWLTARRMLLVRSGAIDICWRDRTADAPAHGSGWSFGQAKYAGDELLLFRSFSLMLGAARRLDRATISLGERRAPLGVECDLLPPDSVVIDCSSGTSSVAQLAIDKIALTGLSSWIESAPATRQRADP
ncbi:MAG: DUF2550 domain-containing protein [Nakamurella sp.]